MGTGKPNIEKFGAVKKKNIQSSDVFGGAAAAHRVVVVARMVEDEAFPWSCSVTQTWCCRRTRR